MKCDVCFRHCVLAEGQVGFCRARKCQDGHIVAANYALVTSLALDPIEKKPLREFYPGSVILSLGSYGCNLRCPFCQNAEISQVNLSDSCDTLSPEEAVGFALRYRTRGNIGLAFTYNEPMVGYEYVRDCAKLAHEKALKTVVVTNGCVSLKALMEVLPYIDAMNIDLKGFCRGYFDYVGGDFEMTKAFIAQAVPACHVELTTLVVPGHNDEDATMEEEAQWIASLDPKTPLHLTRYFPRYHEHTPPTPIPTLKRLEAIAKKYLSSVYLGNL
jgi:pyruvate formate lyase activating enzyme